MINSPLSSWPWSCILPFHEIAELINQTICSKEYYNSIHCNTTLINTITSYRQEDMSSTEMIDISIDTEMLDASISSYSYEDFLSCAPSQPCATGTTTQRCISDGTNSTADVSIDDSSSSKAALHTPSFSFLHIWRKYEGISTALHYCPLFLNFRKMTPFTAPYCLSASF